MKKSYTSVIFLALFLASCQTNQPPAPTSDSNSFLTQPDQTNSGKLSTVNSESSTAILWVDYGDQPVLDDAGLRPIGVWYWEVDLSEPVSWSRKAWDEVGFDVEPRSDLTQILGQRITTRDEAAYIAYRILANEGNRTGGLESVLVLVKHDPDKNIWILVYGDISRVPGSSFSVAVDGESGELIRMWIT